MGYSSQSLFARPEAGPTGDAGMNLDEVTGEVLEMEPHWAQGSGVFHTRARCRRLQAIGSEKLRRAVAAPPGVTLCEFCRQITLLGRKG